MIRLLFGPAGSGKSSTILCRIKALLENGGSAILLVPEQEAVARERQVLSALPPESQLRFEVFNFSRLANHVFRHCGGIGYHRITPGGRALLMWKTLRTVSPFLAEYTVGGQSDAALTALMRSAVSECKAYSVTPERLVQTADALAEDSPLARKLRDLALVFGAYEANLHERWDDGEDDLARAAEFLEAESLFAGAHVFIDSFTDFTAAELAVIRPLVKQAAEVTVALCADGPNDTAMQSVSIIRTSAVLRRMAAKLDVPVKFDRLTENKRTDDPVLAALGGRLWRMEESACLGDSAAVELYSCADPFAEAEAAACRIAALVREGMAYRDIVLIVRDPEAWRGILDAELERANIPYFLSRRTDIATKSVIKLLYSAFALYSAGWRTDDFLTYLKTGCTGLDRSAVDLIEDYVTRWQLHGDALCAPSGWTMDPNGYVTEHTARAEERLEELNRLRASLLAPLEFFFSALAKAEKAADTAAAIYTYLTRIRLPEQLAERAAREAAAGRRAEGAELIQVWNILLDTLDQIVSTYGDDPCGADEFFDALRLILAETDIGTIPTSADQVTVGSAAMLRADSPRCVILLGLCEGEFPATLTDRGFFSGADRRMLESLGLSLSANEEGRAAEELFYVYRAVAAPRERLICLCHRRGTDGREVLPSLAMNRIAGLMDRKPTVWESLPPIERLWTRESAFPYTATLEGTEEGSALHEIFSTDPAYAERTAALRTPITERTCTLLPETADALFGRRMQLSQSRLDAYVGCHFAYFCRYLLRLREEKPARIGYDTVGTYVHAVLERFFTALTVDGTLRLPESERELNERLDTILEEYLRELFRGVPASARTSHLFDRLRRLSRLLIDHLLTEFRQSRFVPVLFELPIRRGAEGAPEPLIFDLPDGTPVWLGGVIDRVDLWQAENGRYYLRVVDYKTGSKEFDRADIDVGYNLQLLLYLFTLCRSRSRDFRARLGIPPEAELTPASMLYCSALAPDLTVSADRSADEILIEADAKLSRRGIVLDEEDVLRAMDSELSGRYIPCRLLKKKEFALSSPESRASAKEFEELYDKLGRTIRRVAGEMRAGHAHAAPNRHGGAYPCATCPVKPVCRAAKK